MAQRLGRRGNPGAPAGLEPGEGRSATALRTSRVHFEAEEWIRARTCARCARRRVGARHPNADQVQHVPAICGAALPPIGVVGRRCHARGPALRPTLAVTARAVAGRGRGVASPAGRAAAHCAVPGWNPRSGERSLGDAAPLHREGVFRIQRPLGRVFRDVEANALHLVVVSDYVLVVVALPYGFAGHLAQLIDPPR